VKRTVELEISLNAHLAGGGATDARMAGYAGRAAFPEMIDAAVEGIPQLIRRRDGKEVSSYPGTTSRATNPIFATTC
jgi:hypothetical protein